jgi:hypothetical protein
VTARVDLSDLETKIMVRDESSKGRLRKAIRLWLTVAFVLVASIGNSGQTQNQATPAGGNEDKAERTCVVPSTRLVVVEVEVRDASGNCVFNLRHNDFLVYEDRKRQEVAFYSDREILETGIFPIKYTIGYYPPNQMRDGGFRSIRVKVRDAKAKGITVRYCPEWYFATANQ